MIYVGIDVAKDKHDCFIMNSEGEVLFKPFVISNNRAGFDNLYEKICSAAESPGVCRPTLSIRYIPIFTEKV